MSQESSSVARRTRDKEVAELCPCRGDWETFEASLADVRALQKDADPAVRAAALHVMEDALQILSSGLPTNPREATNEMLRARRAHRWPVEEESTERHRARKWQKERSEKLQPLHAFRREGR